MEVGTFNGAINGSCRKESATNVAEICCIGWEIGDFSDFPIFLLPYDERVFGFSCLKS